MAKRILLILLALVSVSALTFGGITLVGALTVKTSDSSDSSGMGKGPTVESDTDFGTVTTYAVIADGALDPAAAGLTQHVWDTFKRVVTPAIVTAMVTHFRVGDAPKSDTMAYVYQNDNPAHWTLAVNLAASKVDSDLIATLVHEYGHLITLNDKQINAKTTSCSTLTVEEGCAGDASYLWKFKDQFWSAYTDAPEPTNDDANVASAFYTAHEEDFVSDYAATNVVEDIAESFMTFTLESRPTGDSTIARKLDFFWQYPEFVMIRERIRGEFATELGLR